MTTTRPDARPLRWPLAASQRTPRRPPVGPALLVALLLALSPPAVAADDETPVARRAREVAALIGPTPDWAPDLFDPEFLEAVPPLELRLLLVQLGQLGEAAAVDQVGGSSRLQGLFDVQLGEDASVPMTLTVGPAPQHSVVGLFFGPAGKAYASFEEIAAELAALPGRASFAVARLGDEGPQWLGGHDPDQPLAIGSAFKLWVLGELAAQVASGARAWDDVLRLRADHVSLSSGTLQDWKPGTPLTLQSLATFMISISDNTATDHLLFALGRQAVEARVGAMGHAHPELNVPLLSTAEMFRIKFAPGDETADAYAMLPRPELRRAFLEDEVADLPLSGDGTDPAALLHPNHIDTVEWFASGRDLCRTLDALRRAAGDDRAVLDVLTVNPGLRVLTGRFDEVAFKGGSETGVICLSLLLRRGDRWYALAGAWNDTRDAVDEAAFVQLMTRAGVLLARLDDAR